MVKTLFYLWRLLHQITTICVKFDSKIEMEKKKKHFSENYTQWMDEWTSSEIDVLILLFEQTFKIAHCRVITFLCLKVCVKCQMYRYYRSIMLTLALIQGRQQNHWTMDRQKWNVGHWLLKNSMDKSSFTMFWREHIFETFRNKFCLVSTRKVNYLFLMVSELMSLESCCTL